MHDLLTKSIKNSIILSDHYQNIDLINKVWDLPVAKLYKDIIEYQPTEGYCCSTTQRCILNSIPCISKGDIPVLKGGPVTIDKYSSIIDKLGNGNFKSIIIYGENSYERFLDALKKANDPKYRIAINFLRSSLFGIRPPSWLPSNILLSMFGGHFSHIIGYLDKENLVAVFDVNHNYGLFFVEPERLYESIATHDFTSGKSRGIVITTMN